MSEPDRSGRREVILLCPRRQVGAAHKTNLHAADRCCQWPASLSGLRKKGKLGLPASGAVPKRSLLLKNRGEIAKNQHFYQEPPDPTPRSKTCPAGNDIENVIYNFAMTLCQITVEFICLSFFGGVISLSGAAGRGSDLTGRPRMVA